VTEIYDQATRGAAASAPCDNGRPRLVAGVFPDLLGANQVAEKLRINTLGSVSVLSNGDASLGDLCNSPAAPLKGCPRLYQQISRHLASGSAVVVVDARTPEQQLGASRTLLASHCDVLLTHDGSR
jgi:hypothetical protein